MGTDDSSTDASAARPVQRTVMWQRGTYALGFLVGIMAGLLAIVCVSSRFNFGLSDIGRGLGLSSAFGLVPTLIFSAFVMDLGRDRGSLCLSGRRCTFLAVLAGIIFLGVGVLLAVGLRALGVLEGRPMLACLLSYYLGVPAVLAHLYVLLIQQRQTHEPECPGCGYLLYHVQDRRCPECGRVFTPADIDMTHAVMGDDGVLRPKDESAAKET